MKKLRVTHYIHEWKLIEVLKKKKKTNNQHYILVFLQLNFFLNLRSLNVFKTLKNNFFNLRKKIARNF